MITRLTAAPKPAALRAEQVFQLSESPDVRYVVIALNWCNTSLGSKGLNLKNRHEEQLAQGIRLPVVLDLCFSPEEEPM